MQIIKSFIIHNLIKKKSFNRYLYIQTFLLIIIFRTDFSKIANILIFCIQNLSRKKSFLPSESPKTHFSDRLFQDCVKAHCFQVGSRSPAGQTGILIAATEPHSPYLKKKGKISIGDLRSIDFSTKFTLTRLSCNYFASSDVNLITVM